MVGIKLKGFRQRIELMDCLYGAHTGVKLECNILVRVEGLWYDMINRTFTVCMEHYGTPGCSGHF